MDALRLHHVYKPQDIIMQIMKRLWDARAEQLQQPLRKRARRGSHATEQMRRDLVRTVSFLLKVRGKTFHAWAEHAMGLQRKRPRGVSCRLSRFAGDRGSWDIKVVQWYAGRAFPAKPKGQSPRGRLAPHCTALVQPTPVKVRDALEKLPGFGGTGIVSEHLLESFEYIDRDVGFLPWSGKRSTAPATVGPNPRKLFDAAFPGEPHDECLMEITKKVRSRMPRHLLVNDNRVFCDKPATITIDTHVVQQNPRKLIHVFQL